MKKPFSSKRKMQISFGTVSVASHSKKLIKQILNSNRLSNGRYVRDFEKRFACLVGTKEAVAVSSGTDADALALAVLHDFGAKWGDEIIVPALSFVSTGNAVLQAGFKPVFVDIERKTLNIDPSRIEQAITKKTKAIMPVHLMGKPADMDTITSLAKKYRLYVIEDAAEAHGATYKDKKVGSLGDMAAFSLYLAHIITTIEGGVVTTNNIKFAEIIRSLRNHGRACKCKICIINTNSSYCPKRFGYKDRTDIRFIFERIGFSSKMNELEAAIGIGNLEIYPTILNKRKKNLYYLMEKFKKFSPYITTIKKEPYEEIGPHAFPIIIQEKAKFTRNQLVDYLAKRGIDSRSLFSSMPTQCAGFEFLGYKRGNFPHAEYIGNNGIHIGIHQDLDKKECDYFIDTLEQFLSENL